MEEEKKIDRRIGNQFWKMADPECLGQPRNFPTPTDLWNKAKEYFQECDESPLTSQETTTTDKGVYDKVKQHKVPYTWQGLYVFLGVVSLKRYKEKNEYVPIITHIGNVIYNQKYTGAAAGLFNANIIARDLGLAESVKSEDITKLSKEDRDKRISELKEKLASKK